MINKFKNIITNILGLVFWGFSIKELNNESPEYIYILFLLAVGTVLFRYKFSETKKIINKIIAKKLP